VTHRLIALSLQAKQSEERHEYQAKALLSQYGIPVPRGGVAYIPAEAKKIATELGDKG